MPYSFAYQVRISLGYRISLGARGRACGKILYALVQDLTHYSSPRTLPLEAWVQTGTADALMHRHWGTGSRTGCRCILRSTSIIIRRRITVRWMHFHAFSV